MSDPNTTWNRLRYASDRPGTPGESAACRPIAAVLRCVDATLDGTAVFSQPPGALIDLSSWGLTVDTGVLAGLEYALVTAQVPLIVVLGHDDCAAIRAAVRAWEHAELPDGAMRATVEGMLMSLVGRGASAEPTAHLASAHAVETGLALLKRSPTLSRRLDEGRCGIVCATSHGGALQVHATLGDVREASAALVECV